MSRGERKALQYAVMSVEETKAEAGAKGGEAPERTCVVCREAKESAALVRLTRTGDGHVLPGKAGSGRGAWVCVSAECLSRLSARELARAFGKPVVAFSSAELLTDLAALARQRVLEIVGLARRQNALLIGIDEIGANGREKQGRVVLMAADASEWVRSQAGDEGQLFVPSAELSRAAGLYNVSAVAINPGPLAHQAAYWLSMWYECRSQNRLTGGRPA